MGDGGEFYRSFEDRFRGSRKLIKKRLQVYGPFLKALHDAGLSGDAVDVGCGRGEWLEVAQEAGFKAQGVDLDEGMLAVCYQLGLPAVYGEALSFLRSLPAASQSVVSGFHIAEHLIFDDLRKVVEESFRILKPGGLLILETPNPENFRVSSLTFHLDPSHTRPIPPDLLDFIGRYHGFERTGILRLQASKDQKEFSEWRDVELSVVLGGISPDYAMVAQKPAEDAVMNLFDAVFSQDVGISYNRAVAKFDENIIFKFNQVQTEVEKRLSHELRASIRAAQAEYLDHFEITKFGQLRSEVSVRADYLESEIARLHELLSDRQSGAEKILPQMLSTLKKGVSAWLLLKPGSRPRRVAGRMARVGVGYLRDKPRAKRAAIRLAGFVPSLKARLFRLAAQQQTTMPELDLPAGREWYLEPEPEMQTEWSALLEDRSATEKADR